MSPHQIIAVAVRLYAIWLVIFLISWLPGFIRETQEKNDALISAVVYASFGAVILFVFVLWFFPRTIAHTLLARSEQKAETPASPNEYFSVGCSLIGLWVLSDAIPGLARYGLVLIFASRQNEGVFASTFDLHSGGIFFAIQFLIGVVLLFGAKSIVRLVTRVRYED